MTVSKKSLIMLTTLVVLVMSLHFTLALTGSIGNARMILRPEVSGLFATTVDKSIKVNNVNDEAINIRLEVDESSDDFLSLIDEEFTLQPGESRNAAFQVKVRKAQRYEGKINVFFSPAQEEGAGVVLSSTIIVIPEQASDYEEDEEDEKDKEDTSGVGQNNTGVDVSFGGDKKDNQENKINMPSGLVLLTISTFVLAAVLIGLLFFTNKKSKSKSRKRKVRRKRK